ncbi:hypothetical protein GCM10010182_70620 [Actinomadura cremea]|nr:hypothetical protein GCM10010182_70620 [Actinomadura cremea]
MDTAQLHERRGRERQAVLGDPHRCEQPVVLARQPVQDRGGHGDRRRTPRDGLAAQVGAGLGGDRRRGTGQRENVLDLVPDFFHQMPHTFGGTRDESGRRRHSWTVATRVVHAAPGVRHDEGALIDSRRAGHTDEP